MEKPRKSFFCRLLVIACCLFFVDCRSREIPVPVVQKISPTPQITSTQAPQKIEFKKTRLASRDRNRKFWELTASDISIDEQNKSAQAEEIICIFFSIGARPSITVEARGAKIDMEKESVYFEGQVKARSSTGEILEVKRLVWDGRKKKLLGSEFVRIDGRESIITGKELVADPSLREIEVKGGVRVHLKKVHL